MTAPSTDWKEVVAPDEDARFLRYAEVLRDLQRQNGGQDRGAHAKGNVGLLAELVVDDGLPAHARHGLGAKPGRYGAWVRVSNAALTRQHDKKGDIRGFAFKVIGVDGKKVIPGMENARTQDFLFINGPITAVKNADEFIAIIKAARSPATLPFKLMASVGFGRAITIIKRAANTLGKKLVSAAFTPYWTAAPISWGPYAVKLNLQPKLSPDGTQLGSSADYIGEELAARVKNGPVSWDVRIQFYTDPKATPLEDHDVEWQGEWLTIGTLTIPQQDAGSERGRKVSETLEKASFDPWHALVEHKPLGNMMRARNHAYRLSSQERKAAGEPDGSETF
jgi:hypothetical protein